MPSAFDLVGHNQALQEHWIRRLIAGLVDVIIVGVVSVIANLFVYIFGNFWLLSLTFGVVWWLYSALFEGFIGGTIGKKLLALHVVALDGHMDVVKGLIRDVSKVFWLFIFLDLVIGGLTMGDPRQRFLDRIAGTTVTRVDQHAYMEEQFRMMQHAPPQAYAPAGTYPVPPAPPAGQAPPPAPQQPPQQAPPPGGWPAQAGGWPGQAPATTDWPQHQWDEQGQLKPQMRFCTACGGQLVARGDGKLTCVRCGAVY